jgi:hypothetical protein
MPIEEIQGIKCSYRELQEGEQVLYSNLPKEQQFFTREPVPFTDDELIDIANRQHTYSDLQKKWVEKQEWYFDNGIYLSINGEVTFVCGAYWCYINYWTLEHGEKPDYREDDRIFFLFHEHLRLNTGCLGLTRGKGRRQGATSIGMFFMWFIAGRQEHKLCGTTSFTDKAAEDNFQKMFMYGFKAMLPCFQTDFDSDSENFIRFVKPVDKKKKGVLAVKREGLNSYVDYKSNTINSYDSGRQSYNVPDEGGKRGKVNINSYWSRLYKTFLIGSNKVGFAYLPTTVGGKKDGGENYKLFWKNSSQFEIDKETGEPVGINTINRVVQYFVPATYCYAGCIDKFGKSIVDDPIQPVLSNEGKWITEGSRTIILRERKRLEGEQLMEHRRDYPLDVYDMFSFETGACEFDEIRIVHRIQELEENPQEAYWRRGRLYEEYDIEQRKVITKFADDEKGEWFVKEMPDIENNYSDRNGTLEPLSKDIYSSGADTYKNIFAENGSDGSISIIKKSNVVEGKETGLYPVAFFVGRPKLIKQFNRQVFLGCLWYGTKVNFEIDAGTWFYEDFLEWGALAFLEWTPAIDPTKKDFKIKPGTESANPFQLAKQLEVAKMYFDGTSISDYNGNIFRVTYIPLLKQALEYNHSERTPYHLVVSFMMALLPIFARPHRAYKEQQYKPKSILPVYRVRLN